MTSSDFTELRQLVTEAGLLEKSIRPTIVGFITNVALLLLSISVFFLTQHLGIILLNAAFLALIYGRFGLLAHDLGHMQVFKSKKANNALGYICATIVGLSHSWWKAKHNAHHAHTNHHEEDPDIDLPILAYSEKQALEKKGAARFIVKHQAWFFLPIQLLAAVSLRYSSWKYVLKPRKNTEFVLDLFLSSLHATIYLSLLFLTQEWWVALLFILVHQHLWSLYITSIFAPNHKGMPIMEEGTAVDFMREQILTARNIKPGILTDYYYGHLNYQIEHHLFPTMSRKNMRKARKIVKQFCKEKNIDYHETSVIQSYVEIIQHMHEISLCLR
jgi:fatty acid desaturase